MDNGGSQITLFDDTWWSWSLMSAAMNGWYWWTDGHFKWCSKTMVVDHNGDWELKLNDGRNGFWRLLVRTLQGSQWFWNRLGVDDKWCYWSSLAIGKGEQWLVAADYSWCWSTIVRNSNRWWWFVLILFHGKLFILVGCEWWLWFSMISIHSTWRLKRFDQ